MAMKLMRFFSVLVMLGSVRSDTNVPGGMACGDSTVPTATFQTNRNTLLNSLATNAPVHDGFYKTTVGKHSDILYGLVQCRGDVSPTDCANCTQAAISEAFNKEGCPNSTYITIWLSWCTLTYSKGTFFESWRSGSMAVFHNNGSDDPDMGSRGLAMIHNLVTTVPSQRLMFQTGVVDVGQGRKRYGLAQCNRDLSKAECGKCLNDRLDGLISSVQNRRGWEIHGVGCRIWYDDYKFYFNISKSKSKSVTSGTERTSRGGTILGVVSIMLSAFLLIFRR